MDKLPPNSKESEQAVLGALMIDNSLIPEVSLLINEDDFYNVGHRFIFGAIKELSNKNIPVDLISLSNYLSERNALANMGGVSYIASLLDAIPTTANTLYYANIINETAMKRKISWLGQKLISLGQDQTKSTTELYGQMQEIYEGVVNSRKLTSSRETSKELFGRISTQIPERFTPLIGISTGFKELDYITGGWNPAELILIGARPSIGKTAFVLNSILHSWNAQRKNIPGNFIVYSLEQSKEQLALRCVSSLHDNDNLSSLDLRRGGLKPHIRAEVNGVINKLSNAPIVWYREENRCINHFFQLMREEYRKYPTAAIIIDHVGQFTYPGLENQPTAEATQIMASLQAFKDKLNISLIGLHQLSRQVESRQDKRPVLSDLRQTGNSEQAADKVLFLYRDEYYNKHTETPGIMEVDIAKGRDCPVGRISLNFNKYTLSIFGNKKEEELEEYETPY